MLRGNDSIGCGYRNNLNGMNCRGFQVSMNTLRRFITCSLLTLAVWIGGPQCARAETANRLTWDRDKGKVSADLRDWGLLNLLEEMASQSGWHIFVEPDSDFRASAKFQELSPGEALRRLLGNLNYTMMPQTNGPQRLYVFRTVMKNATQQVRSANSRTVPKAKRVPNELIIRVKPGTDVEALAKSLGAKVVGSIPELNAYRLQFESEEAADAARQKLLADPNVASVENNYYLDTPFTPQSLGGMSAPQMNLTLEPNKNDSGKVVVGLVDTSLSKLDPALEQFIKERLSLAGESSADGRNPTHADAMLNALLQAAQQALGGSAASFEIVPVDIFGKSATADAFTSAVGMYEAYKHGATIISASFGSHGESQFMYDVAAFILGQGVPIVAAIGNDGSSVPFLPAAIPGVTAVTAIENGKVASWASIGTTPDAAAPSQVIFYYNGLVYGSRGTSVSTAATTGVAIGLANKTGRTTTTVMPAVQQVLAVPK
jgi:hypothetical protein